jgi:hypothetical protein
MTDRQPREEGAAQTKLIMGAVKSLRLGKGWSAERLAEEMTKAGVPWNADIVVNLEHGRRKSLRVHELLALAFVLDAQSPVDLIVPGDEVYPVVPGVLVDAEDVRAWCRGTTGPLRRWLSDHDAPPQALLESVAQHIEQTTGPEAAARVRSLARLLRDGSDGKD